VDVRESVDTYPDDPRPIIEDTSFIDVVFRIPWTVDVRDSVDIYADDPRPLTVDTILPDKTPPELAVRTAKPFTYILVAAFTVPFTSRV